MEAASLSPNPLEVSANSLANLLKSSGDPLRIQILRALAQDSFGVLELSHIFGIKQSSMSHHLKVLANAHLVSTRREGNSIFYRRSTPLTKHGFVKTRAALASSISELALPDEVNQRITEIHLQRSQTSKDFFAEHGASLKEKQDLIAAFEVYGEPVAKFLNHSQVNEWHHAMEIGPGEGEFLPVLAEKFTEVSALDNSQIMLEKSSAHCAEKQLANITFHLADTAYCRQQAEKYDCIVINMVLHHMPSPQQIFADVSKALKNQGVFIICELCNHDQDWTRKACGDLWLGFEPKELAHWASNFHLTEGQSTYFALRNGFQIQIREFLKP